ncbi:class I SAM-dependent methyltransferase [Pasteurella bettyae]|uniref:class I SAM-dependent methyltransferase n=1 Tax=Pasteurella bettyae TaxID=752 RepID=UPI000591545A|nr:class I SAM-dependent methyltransferase [Pasteurella bettyae]SUB21101.1 methyltransferase type 11 family protein [Pasteurella bettyae]
MLLNLNQNSLLDNVTNYWDNRAKDYSQHNQQELQSIKRDKWKKTLLGHVPQGASKVLDVGMGPGFFAILMAKAGFQVTGIDATHNMLEQAKQNAQQANVNIDFVQGDVHQLPFADESFDVIVTRNVTWNLQHPEQAYQEWFRVLKPNGRLINFDANWYLYLYDEQRRKAFEQDRANTAKRQIEDHYENTDTHAMEAIARQLPLSRQLRPHWDLQQLLNIGFSQFVVDTKIGERLWDDIEKINYCSTPMFMIVAQK